jgi:HK97 family phage major capsid protein
MSATRTNASATAKRQLDAVRSAISDLRDERASAQKKRDELASQATDQHGAFDVTSAAFAKAEKASNDLREVEDKIAVRKAEELRLLGLLGEGGGASPEASADVPAPLVETDGAWLQAVLLDQVDTIPGARDKLAASGVMAGPLVAEGLDTTEAGTVAAARAVIELYRPLSVLAAAGVPILRVGSTEARVPWVKGRPEAGWSEEGKPFAKGSPAVEMVPVTPKRCGLVSPLSIEVYEDISPEALAAVQRAIIAAVALEADAGLIAGSGEGPEPLGIMGQAGIGAAEGSLTGLGVFTEAVGAMIGDSVAPSVLLINPEDLTALSGVVKFEDTSEGGGLVSNEPLIPISATQGRETSLLPGVRWYATKAVPKGKALLFDPLAVAVVLRKAADLSIDPFYNFDDGLIALRTFLRADVLVQPEGVMGISFK